jgi:hypothetical protein
MIIDFGKIGQTAVFHPGFYQVERCSIDPKNKDAFFVGHFNLTFSNLVLSAFRTCDNPFPTVQTQYALVTPTITIISTFRATSTAP